MTNLRRPFSFNASSRWDHAFVSNLAVFLSRLSICAIEQHGTALDTIVESSAIETFASVVTSCPPLLPKRKQGGQDHAAAKPHAMSSIFPRTLACALHALASLTQDYIRVVPRVIDAGAS